MAELGYIGTLKDDTLEYDGGAGKEKQPGNGKFASGLLIHLPS